MGSALMQGLRRRGAMLTGISRGARPQRHEATDHWLVWDGTVSASLEAALQTVDVLVINHGVNPVGRRDASAIHATLQANLMSAQALIELFFRQTRDLAPERQSRRELWVNTSEAEVGPALSPIYEVSKRSLGTLLTLQTLDAPCVVRRLVLGPFRSNLNPHGVMSAEWVAERVLCLAGWNWRLIIVTPNPLTYLLMPLAVITTRLYGQLCMAVPATAGAKIESEKP